MHKRAGVAFWAAALMTCTGEGGAENLRFAARELADLSLEQLSNIVVHSVSRRDEPLARAASSIYVISGEDIRRSGATSLPEALRLAPNLQVARVDAVQYAISARGFNNTLANKLLVLIDGRTVYTPLFSGTFWEVQDLMLEDIERIEVISGPGATLWGANAVNGVINVITRPASATQGTLVAATAGELQREAAARHGGKIGAGHYRFYAKQVRRDHTTLPTGAPVRDQADHTQIGFRTDWARAADGFTLQGDAYGGEIDQAPDARELAGANLLARWTRDLGQGSALRLQAYYDQTYRHHPGTFKEELHTFDTELQHSLERRGRHRPMWGFGLRYYRDKVENSPSLAFLPANRSLERNHLFVQDEISLGERVDLTLGAKVETNTYTDAEFLPSARLGWRPSAEHLVWSAVSRAVRAPSRIDREFFIPGNAPFALAGGPQFQSEISNVYELGYRGQPSARASWSATAFYHDHDKVRSVSPQAGGAVVANDREGHTKGIEAWAGWRVSEAWRLQAGYTHLETRLRVREGAIDTQAPSSIGSDPKYWWHLRSTHDLAAAWDLDVMLRHVDGVANRGVPAYTAVDARLAWHAARRVELSLLVQNLFDPGHVEWAPGAELERAAYLKARIGF